MYESSGRRREREALWSVRYRYRVPETKQNQSSILSDAGAALLFNITQPQPIRSAQQSIVKL